MMGVGPVIMLPVVVPGEAAPVSAVGQTDCDGCGCLLWFGGRELVAIMRDPVGIRTLCVACGITEK